MTPYLLVIDGFSTASQYRASFAAHGVRSIHLHAYDHGGGYPLDLAGYDVTLRLDGSTDLSAVMAKLEPYNIVAAEAGLDAAIPLLDEICRRLGLPGNDPELSLSRLDKYEMVAAISRAGLKTAAQKKTSQLADALNWQADAGTWPVIAKPSLGTANNNVFICTSARDIEHAHARIVGQPNIFGVGQAQLVLQEYLRGDEFIVNGVSARGKHYISDIWKYKWIQEGRSTAIRDDFNLVPEDDSAVEPLRDYTCRMLDAVGVLVGPSHSEIMLTPEGAAVVEIASRPMGINFSPECLRNSVGYSQVDLTLMAHLQPEQFLRAFGGKVYSRQNCAKVLCLISNQHGTIRSDRHLEKLSQIKSVCGTNMFRKKDDELVPTTDQYTCPGYVFMTSRSSAELERDSLYIRGLEEEGLFDVG
ncbi:ATP-grasp domain-containing protein [Roseibium sp. RKSG952]|uniref:ATP-grasp domain-containing protein n=1 Tax=Roseibium sp. RKSG952 TaxID=2529384 RepID=UPI001FCB144E|nr:ATP-grasp domain-containing protein [Roseibium sp. RKSG952]